VTQSYAARVAARPHYARLKNRKKTIRRRWQAGRIDDTERARLLAEARDAYAGLAPGRPAQLVEWLDGPGRGVGHCESDECLAAVGNVCRCGCEGRWHGAALGLPPLDERPGAQPVSIECAHCGRRATGTPRLRYCSSVCQQRAWRRRQRPARWRRTCPVCGLEFDRRPSPNRRYCGIDCRREAKRRRARKRTEPTPMVCAECGQPGSGPPTKRYCGAACWQRAYRARKRTEPTPMVCAECGQPGSGPPTKRYCGAACQQRAYQRAYRARLRAA